VRVPGVHVRGNDALSSHSYAVLLDEHLVVAGTTFLEMRYCPAEPSVFQALAIPDAALESAKNPLTGGRGYWVPQQYWEVVRSHGLELWEEPLVFVVHHLEAVLRQNLADF